MPRKLLFCSFALFFIVFLTPFINKSDSSRDLTIVIISFVSSFEVIDVVHLVEGRMPEPKIFFQITAPDADVAAINPNGIKILLANG